MAGRCSLRLSCWRLRQQLCCSRVENGLQQGDRDGTTRLESLRRKYSEAMQAKTEHVGAPPGTLGGGHAVYYQGDPVLDRLSTQFNMAGVLDDMGEWQEARQMYEAVIVGRTHELGKNDPATLDAKWYLAMLLMDSPRHWGKSRKLWYEVALGYSSAYGCCHRNTNAGEQALLLGLNLRYLSNPGWC
jgi:hypothetical protein